MTKVNAMSCPSVSITFPSKDRRLKCMSEMSEGSSMGDATKPFT